MIELINNALQLDTDCALVSCRYDPTALQQQSLATLESQWGVRLPTRLQGAVDKRKAEFIAGRFCAHRALARLDEEQAVTKNSLAGDVIGIGDKRQPLWPPGLCGSITHSHGFAAAATARQNTIRALGIDSEQRINTETAQNVASHILTEEETFADNRNIVNTSAEYLTLVFSAKESIFKCLYPLVKHYFDFKDAVVIFSTATPNRFTFRLRKTLTEEFCQDFRGEGLYQCDENFIHTAVVQRN